MTEEFINEILDSYIDRIHELVELGYYNEATSLYEEVREIVVEKVPN